MPWRVPPAREPRQTCRIISARLEERRTKRKRVELQAIERGLGYHLLAVCLRSPAGYRIYRQPSPRDYAVLKEADEALALWQEMRFADVEAIPHEELPYLRSIFNVRVYGIDQWHKLFHRRQLLSALNFTQIVRDMSGAIRAELEDERLSDAVIQCLALTVSNSLQYQCSIATYLSEGIKSAFIQGQSLPMKMDFIEANPLMDDLAGGYQYTLDLHLSALRYNSHYSSLSGSAVQASATTALLPESSVDLLATDPPYYDVVPYADCSDFFYVWLRRMLRGISTFPTETATTPKSDEIVQLAERNAQYKQRTKQWFELKMCEALRNAKNGVKPSGGAVIVFAHKETAAWEALLQSVLDAGWTITSSWPIDTEKATRLRANDSAVLASSIHLYCRPREYLHVEDAPATQSIGEWRDVLAELPRRISAWMPMLVAEGIVGADAIFSCLGPALEIFSRYSSVEKSSGEPVSLHEYLEHVWAAVARSAMGTIFDSAEVTIFEEDARLTALWLWTLFGGVATQGAEPLADAEADDINDGDDEEVPSSKPAVGGNYTLEFDAARKIAQGLGAHLDRLTTVVDVKGEKARLLPVAERARILFGKEAAQSAVATRKRPAARQLTFSDVAATSDPGSFGDALGDAGIGVSGVGDEWSDTSIPDVGRTVLDRLHQSMLLFAAGRGEALKRFLVENGIGQDERFWRLAQALSALYPMGSDEKRWVDGVLARKKGWGM